MNAKKVPFSKRQDDSSEGDQMDKIEKVNRKTPNIYMYILS